MPDILSLSYPLLCAVLTALVLWLRPVLCRQRSGRALFVACVGLLAAGSYSSIAFHAQSATAALAFGAALLFSAVLLKATSLVGRYFGPTASPLNQGKRAGPERTPPLSSRPAAAPAVKTPSLKPRAGETSPAARPLDDVLPVGSAQDEAPAQNLWLFCSNERQRLALLASLVERMRMRGQRIVLADRNAEMLRMLWDESSDVVFNPRDERSVPWSPLRELSHELDAHQVAQSLLTSLEQEPPARILKKATELAARLVEALRHKNQASLEQLAHLVQQASAHEMEALLEQAGITALVDDEDFSQVRQLIDQALQGFTPSGNSSSAPSLCEWLRRPGPGVWFATYHDLAQAALARSVLDVAARAALTSATTPAGRRSWLVVDNLCALGRVPVVENSLAKLKKRGTCVAAGFESWRQAAQTWGAEGLAARAGLAELKFFANPLDFEEALDIATALLPVADKSPGGLPGQLVAEADPHTLKALPRAQSAAKRLLELPAAHWLLWRASDTSPLTLRADDDPSSGHTPAFVPRKAHTAATLSPAQQLRPEGNATSARPVANTLSRQELLDEAPSEEPFAAVPALPRSAVFGKWAAPAPEDLVEASPGRPPAPPQKPLSVTPAPKQAPEATPLVEAKTAEPPPEPEPEAELEAAPPASSPDEPRAEPAGSLAARALEPTREEAAPAPVTPATVRSLQLPSARLMTVKSRAAEEQPWPPSGASQGTRAQSKPPAKAVPGSKPLKRAGRQQGFGRESLKDLLR